MKKLIKVGSDFSGVGAFEQALDLLKINYEVVFACDMDKYARETYIANYGEPKYYPKDVYEREIPKEPLDLLMESPPCQGFSMAGNRKGSILFHNSHEFIKKNNPRYFIFENVKGLLSHDRISKDSKEIGKTFQTWINYLGGKSVNGNPVLFPMDEAVHYHIYWKVLNTKNFGIPQNRERVFIIGIRDDEDNTFRWPQEMPLTTTLKDILEVNVDEKYYLSDKSVANITYNIQSTEDNGINKVGNTNPSGRGMNGIVYSDKGISPTISTNKGEGTKIQETPKAISYTRDAKGKVVSRHENDICNTVHTATGSGGNTDQFIKVNSATSKGYEEAKEGDSINFSVPNSKTRRGRVGKGVAQTLDTACNQATIVAMRGRGEENKQQLEDRKDGLTNSITTVQKDNLVQTNRIRRLTPLECFRLQGFPDEFVEKAREAGLSDTQLYKQAGNSITREVLAAIISKLNL
jgi:DNA (cytosine-5)-methyltransferase 1